MEEARSVELEASGLMEVDTDCEKGRGNGVEAPDEGEKNISGNVEKLHRQKEGGCESPLKESVKGENLEILSEEKELLDPPYGTNNLKPENLQKNVDAGEGSPDTADEENETEEESKDVNEGVGKELPFFEENLDKSGTKNTRKSYSWETQYEDGYESGTEEEQNVFRREIETFYKESGLEFKAPKFYKGDVNLLKLYRVVLKLGGYEQVTSRKIWRNVGAPFNPPKTCTTVSWSFRIFYEKALLEYEKHRMRCGELPFTEDSYTAPKVENQRMISSHQVGVNQSSSGSGRAVRDAAARAMHVWNSPHMVDGEDGKLNFSTKSDRNQKSVGGLKRSRRPSTVEHTALRDTRIKAAKPQTNAVIIDAGPPADWVKINVYRIGDCFEVYALVPGLLREEVHVQSDPAGRLIITGQPRELDNPWGVTPFKKVVSLPSRIDPHQTSAVVTLTGQLFVRVPFEQTDMD